MRPPLRGGVAARARMDAMPSRLLHVAVRGGWQSLQHRNL